VLPPNIIFSNKSSLQSDDKMEIAAEKASEKITSADNLDFEIIKSSLENVLTYPIQASLGKKDILFK
jgi:hypothetical protein